MIPELDKARIRWGAEGVMENRRALSRWAPAWTDRFEAFIARATHASGTAG